MKKEKIISVFLALVLLVGFVTACGKTDTPAPAPAPSAAAPEAAAPPASLFEASGTPRTVEQREDANPGDPITPSTMRYEGIANPGAVPLKKFFIAYSEGEMGDVFTRTLFEDVSGVGQQYVDRFGIRFEYTIAGNNSSQQLQDIQSLIAKRPDLLIVNPNEAEPLDVVVQWCEDAGIPLIMFDKEVVTQPGVSTYVAVITYDMFLQGAQIGAGIVQYLEQAKGEAKGDVAEIAGILGAVASVHRSQGMNAVIQNYPDINVVVMRPGEWDNAISYAASLDILSTFQPGTIDVVVGNCDEQALAFMEAASSVGRRDEFNGGFVGADSAVEMIKNILNGQAYSTAENGPFYGFVLFEYAIRWLNGEAIQNRVMLPNRFFRIENEEQRAAMQHIVEYCEEHELEFVPAELGYYDVFNARPPLVEQYYPVFYFSDPARYDSIPYYTATSSTIR